MKYDVVIIGGGVAGIVACLACIQYGFRPVLIERNVRLGGRILTIYQDESQYEAGAGRVSSHHVRVLSLLKAFGLHMQKIPAKIQYREKGKRAANPVRRLLRKVFDASVSIPPEVLYKKRFGELCIDILGSYRAKLLQSSFGYNAEFEKINALDGLHMFRNDFDADTDFYYCREGLSEWIRRMEQAIHDSNIATILKGHTVVNWFRTKLGYGVVTQNMNGKIHKVYGKAVICTIPKDDLLQVPIWSDHQRMLLDTVESIPLHRIYGKFPLQNGQSWFHDIPRTTTDNAIRQFIPVSPSIAMMSYTDTDDAKYWYQYANQGDQALRKALLSHMHVVFPDVARIPNPTWINTHYWNAGVHMWKAGVDSRRTYKHVMQPYGKDHPFFIAGETYSLNQAWMEGALETVDEVLPMVVNHLRASFKGGSADHFQEWLKSQKYRIMEQELASLPMRFPDILWVTMQDPRHNGRRVLVNVTNWQHTHPGGSFVFAEHKYKDVTNIFRSIHFLNGQLKPNVLHFFQQLEKNGDVIPLM